MACFLHRVAAPLLPPLHAFAFTFGLSCCPLVQLSFSFRCTFSLVTFLSPFFRLQSSLSISPSDMDISDIISSSSAFRLAPSAAFAAAATIASSLPFTVCRSSGFGASWLSGTSNGIGFMYVSDHFVKEAACSGENPPAFKSPGRSWQLVALLPVWRDWSAMFPGSTGIITALTGVFGTFADSVATVAALLVRTLLLSAMSFAKSSRSFSNAIVSSRFAASRFSAASSAPFYLLQHLLPYRFFAGLHVGTDFLLFYP